MAKEKSKETLKENKSIIERKEYTKELDGDSLLPEIPKNQIPAKPTKKKE